jgi:selenide,water dikinase
VDFFAPLVDDPHDYGAIAAANALSDVYAMGGEAVLALNVAAFPSDLPSLTVSQILRGGADKVAEAGAVVAGTPSSMPSPNTGYASSASSTHNAS